MGAGCAQTDSIKPQVAPNPVERTGTIAEWCNKVKQAPEETELAIPGVVQLIFEENVSWEQALKFATTNNLRYSGNGLGNKESLFRVFKSLWVKVPVEQERCWADELEKEPEIKAAGPNYKETVN